MWGWSFPGPAATTSPSVGRSFDFGVCLWMWDSWFDVNVRCVIFDKGVKL